MQITVNYMAQVKKATNIPTETLDLEEPSTVQDFIKHNLCKRHEKLGQTILDSDGSIKSIMLIFHGDQKVTNDDVRQLQDGDKLTIMTPITGG